MTVTSWFGSPAHTQFCRCMLKKCNQWILIWWTLQLTSLLGAVRLNIQEAHAFFFVDGYCLYVFVVDGWSFEVFASFFYHFISCIGCLFYFITNLVLVEFISFQKCEFLVVSLFCTFIYFHEYYTWCYFAFLCMILCSVFWVV